MADRRRFLVTLEGDGPGAHRLLARWLKAALRQYGLRCVDLRAVPTERPQPAPVDRPRHDLEDK